jgi:hypothetical protein
MLLLISRSLADGRGWEPAFEDDFEDTFFD